MLSVILILVGAALMVFGLCMLLGWIGGQSRWLDPGVLERRGATKNERQFLDLYYVAVVLAPLLCGAILIAFGLRNWL